MKQIVCLIANFDRSFQYGIGRYIQQLTTTSFPNINLYLLLLNANVKKVTISTYDLFNKIEIPAINEKYSKILEQRYYRSVCYFLKEEILTTLNGKYIFHINIPHDSFLTYKKFRNDLLSFSKVIYNGIEDSYSAITQKRKFEEFGYVAIEMMMHRLPIIVTDTSGLSEIVTDNFDGLKVPILHNDNKETDIDCNILSNHIVTLLSNNSKRNIIAKNARKTYLKKYTKNIFTSQINDMHQTIFNKF